MEEQKFRKKERINHILEFFPFRVEKPGQLG